MVDQSYAPGLLQHRKVTQAALLSLVGGSEIQDAGAAWLIIGCRSVVIIQHVYANQH